MLIGISTSLKSFATLTAAKLDGKPPGETSHFYPGSLILAMIKQQLGLKPAFRTIAELN